MLQILVDSDTGEGVDGRAQVEAGFSGCKRVCTR